jgi:hypothetical protein
MIDQTNMIDTSFEPKSMIEHDFKPQLQLLGPTIALTNKSISERPLTQNEYQAL